MCDKTWDENDEHAAKLKTFYFTGEIKKNFILIQRIFFFIRKISTALDDTIACKSNCVHTYIDIHRYLSVRACNTSMCYKLRRRKKITDLKKQTKGITFKSKNRIRILIRKYFLQELYFIKRTR